MPDAAGAAGRAWRRLGLGLGLALTATLLVALAHDRNSRIVAAERQSLAVARGIDLLVRHEIGHLEGALRVLGGKVDRYVAGHPGISDRDIRADIRDVMAENTELAGIELYTRSGSAIHPDMGEGGAWAAAVMHGADGPDFTVGGLLMSGQSSPSLPVALRTPAQNWLVARMRASKLERLVDDTDVGRAGVAAILDRGGRILARTGTSGQYVGRRVTIPAVAQDDVANAVMVSPLDGVRRRTSFASTRGFPFIVAVASAEREVLGAWWTYTSATVLFLLCYWIGFVYTSRSLAKSERARAAAQAELVRHADWLGKAQDASRAGVWALDLERDLVRATAQAASLFGFAAREALVPVHEFFERMHPEDRARVQAVLADAIARDAAFHAEYRIVLPDGQVRWIDASGGMAGLGSGARLMTGTIVDVTERRDALREVERAERQFRELFDRNPLPFWVFEVESLRFLAVNEAAVKKYGYSAEEFSRMTILDVRPPEDREAAAVSAAHPQDRETGRIWRHQTRDGSLVFARIYSSSIGFDGRDARLVLAEDVSEQVAYEEQLAWAATHDETTGLLKLGALLADVDAASRDGAAGYAVVYLQLRELEVVAPTLGRRLGQAIVAEVARRLAGIAADFGPVAYVPADAFVMVASDARHVDELCQRVSHALAQPIGFGGGSHRADAWMGVARAATGSSARAETAVDHAALAALQSRTTPEGAATYFEGMAEDSAQRLALVARLRNAIANAELQLGFQPICEVASGRIVAAEALLRWRGPDGVYVPPSVFVPLAEESGQIVAIGQWVIEHAAQARSRLEAAGFGSVAVAVNVSAMQLSSGDITELVRSLTHTLGLQRAGFHVEITESAMLRNRDVVRQSLEKLRAAGVGISIDDFGTGFSSMAYLRDLPLDHLKIDMSFVSGVDRDAKNAAICTALIALAHGIGLEVIAEGVERQAEFDWLAAHGCDHVQGYFIGRPGPLEGLLERLAADASNAGHAYRTG